MVDELYSQTEQTKDYDVNENISTDKAIILNKKFEVRYLYILDQTKMNVTLSTDETPKLCRLYIHDKEDLIHKASG